MTTFSFQCSFRILELFVHEMPSWSQESNDTDRFQTELLLSVKIRGLSDGSEKTFSLSLTLAEQPSELTQCGWHVAWLAAARCRLEAHDFHRSVSVAFMRRFHKHHASFSLFKPQGSRVQLVILNNKKMYFFFFSLSLEDAFRRLPAGKTLYYYTAILRCFYFYMTGDFTLNIDRFLWWKTNYNNIK